jgi:hypothetical protein
MVINAESIKSKQIQQQSEVISQILKMLAEIQFGSIEITIHDSKIAQIERKEKIRPRLDLKN